MLASISRRGAHASILCRRVRVGPARRFSSASAQVNFDWQDPFATKRLLTEEELAILETAERYCQERLAPRVIGKWAS